MYCYSYKVINNTETPILKNVDVVLILTMEGSTRLKEDPFILNLAKKTLIQYNKGFRKCNKPSIITSVRQDIVHAYYTAFNYLKDYNNVIIFEDDALVINKDILIYEKIDNFINTHEFNVFTFGSNGIRSKYNNDFYKFDKYPFISYKSSYIVSQANIYSINARNKLIQDISSSNFNKGQMDSHYISYLDNIFTYKYPLIVQLFPNTENMECWGCNTLMLYLTKFMIAILKLDTHTDAWFFFYFIFRNYKIIVLLLLVLLIIIIKIKYYNKNKILLVKNTIIL